MILKQSQQIVNTIFSNEIFDEIDTKTLLKKYDITSDIYKVNAKIKPSQEVKLQDSFEIDSIPPQGIKITKKGHYTFSSDIHWQPDETEIAISIQCSGVSIDFNQFTLFAHIKDIRKSTIGINILNPKTIFFDPKLHKELTDITIINGTLSGLTLYGICAQTVSHLHIENVTIDKMHYKNLLTANISPAGIHVNTAKSVQIENCKVTNLSVTSSSCAGIQLIETSKGTLIDCQMNHFTNHDGSTQGYSYIFSHNITSTNCESIDFTSHYQGKTTTLGHTVIGFCPWFCSDLQFNNCKSIGMTGCCDDCHGMSVFLAMNVEVINFHAADVLDGSGTNTGAKATGLEVYGLNVTIEDCTVENIKAIAPQDLQSAGFSAWGAIINFSNCKATNVQVLDKNKNPNTAYGYGVGFGWAPDPRIEFRNVAANFVTYSGCKSVSCQVAFDTWNHIESTWKDNISQENCETSILVQIKGQRTLSANKCSECPKPFSVTLTNMAKKNVYPELS